MSILDNIVWLYNFNWDANDSSWNNFHWTINGAILANDNLGNSNSAYSFNGVSNTLELPSNMLLWVDWYTVCFWFNPVTKLTRSRPIGSSSLFTWYYWNTWHWWTDFTWYVWSWSAYSWWNTASSFISFWVWQFICISYDKTTWKLFKDWVLAQTQTYSSATINQTNIIEIWEWANNFCEWIIAQAKVYNRALSDAEILQLYNTGRWVHSEVRWWILSKSISNIGIDTTWIVAMYNFNWNANDSSGNWYNGTVTWATLTTNRFWDNNSAYSFDSITESYIRLHDTPYDITWDVTYSFWMYCTLWNNVWIILSKYWWNSTGHMEIQNFYSAWRNYIWVLFRWTLNAQMNVWYWWEIDFLENTWYDISITYNYSTWLTRAYVNWIFIKESTQNVWMWNNSTQFTIWARASDITLYKYDWKVEYFYPFNRILSDAEIMQLANVKRWVHSLTKWTQIVNHTDNIWVDTTSLAGLYNASWVDMTWNWNTASASWAVTYSEDTYWNYIDFNWDSDYTAWTWTQASLAIWNKMNYNQTTDYSWTTTVSVLSLPPSWWTWIFWSWFDNSVYISNTTWDMQVSIRWSTNVFVWIWTNYWGTRLWEVHTIGLTYVASEGKCYVYLDWVLQNVWGTLCPTTFLTNEWSIWDSAIWWGNRSSCHKKIYNVGVFGRILTEAEHLKLHNKTVGKWVRNKWLLSINQLTNL